MRRSLHEPKHNVYCCCTIHSNNRCVLVSLGNSGVPRNFFRGGVQQIQLRTEDRENGNLGAVAP
jgi:hypothetical protein